MTWYVVTEDRSWRGETEAGSAAEKVWTVSRDPEKPGWETDGGFSGYGLTKADAQFLADAANEKEARQP